MSERSTVLLEHHLKELKLPSFLREYGKAAEQCAAESVDHPGYLLRLSELELIDRHHRMVGLRVLKLAPYSSFGWAVWAAVADDRLYRLYCLGR